MMESGYHFIHPDVHWQVIEDWCAFNCNGAYCVSSAPGSITSESCVDFVVFDLEGDAARYRSVWEEPVNMEPAFVTRLAAALDDLFDHVEADTSGRGHQVVTIPTGVDGVAAICAHNFEGGDSTPGFREPSTWRYRFSSPLFTFTLKRRAGILSFEVDNQAEFDKWYILLKLNDFDFDLPTA